MTKDYLLHSFSNYNSNNKNNSENIKSNLISSEIKKIIFEEKYKILNFSNPLNFLALENENQTDTKKIDNKSNNIESIYNNKENNNNFPSISNFNNNDVNLEKNKNTEKINDNKVESNSNTKFEFQLNKNMFYENIYFDKVIDTMNKFLFNKTRKYIFK